MREHLGDTQGAIAAYGEYGKRYKTRDDVRQVAFRVGVVYAEAGQHEAGGAGVRRFRAQLSAGRAGDRGALARRAPSLRRAGQDKRAQEPLEAAVALYRKRSADKGRRDRRRTRAISRARWSFTTSSAEARLGSEAGSSGPSTKNRSCSSKAKAIYIDVVTFGDPEWATAALYRIGDAYERFSKALRDAPVPTELDAEEQQVYRDELEKVVVVVEEKAHRRLQGRLSARRCSSGSTTSSRRSCARRSGG